MTPVTKAVQKRRAPPLFNDVCPLLDNSQVTCRHALVQLALLGSDVQPEVIKSAELARIGGAAGPHTGFGFCTALLKTLAFLRERLPLANHLLQLFFFSLELEAPPLANAL
jgi:hypothetical protein